MNSNARNQLQGRIAEIKEADMTADILIDIGGGNQITSTISMDSYKKLGLRKGTIISAIFDFTSVTISVGDYNYSDCSLGCDA